MTNARDEDGRRDSALYRWVWRWHFFAGLLVAPFLVTLAVTGGLYLFADEIEGWWYRDLVRVAPSAAPLAPEAQERAVLAAYPGAAVARYTAPGAPDRAAEWQLLTPHGESRTVFVDPGRGAVRGALASDRRLMNVVRRLHGELLLGHAGNLLVELAACWTLILLATGAFLWWPRRGSGAGGVLWPRLHARGRLLVRDLHAVPAVWNSALVAFLVLSGLPWSGFWGEQLAKLGTLDAALAPTPNFRAPAHDHAAPADLPWAVRKAGLPRAGEAASARPIALADVMRAARERGLEAPGLRVLYPQGEHGVFTLSFVPAAAQGQRTVHLDPASGAVLEDVGWAQYSALGKAVELGVETHVGKQFGRANQLVLAASCALTVTTVALGALAWWRRRPAGGIGAPAAPAGFAPGALVAGVAIALGVFFPLAGASMLVALAGDALARRLRRA